MKGRCDSGVHTPHACLTDQRWACLLDGEGQDKDAEYTGKVQLTEVASLLACRWLVGICVRLVGLNICA